MEKPLLYRRWYIPAETVFLKDDEILCSDKNLIVTKWRVLKPRKDFTNGCSCYHIDKGFKLSKFYNNDKFLYVYCDIIETEFVENKIIFNDLLIDIVIDGEGRVKLLDLGEVPAALDGGLITIDQAKDALNKADNLLSIIYSGKLDELLGPLNSMD